MINKLKDIPTTIFAEMSRKAAKYNAINLSQGFPDFDCSPRLVELLAEKSRKGHNQYAPMEGVLQLREKLCAKYEKVYNANYSPDNEIVITDGATQALYTAITAFIEQGDEVIIIEPAYDAYAPAVLINGGIPKYVSLTYPDFQIPWAEVRALVSDKTKLIVVNTPHNPTGSMVTASDWDELVKIVAGTNILVMSDEVYEHIIFDGKSHASLVSVKELREQSIVISSFGKTFHTTGWKIGYCLAPKHLINDFKKVHQYVTYAVNTPAQFAYAAFLDYENEYLDLPAFYQNKRDLLRESMLNTKAKLLTCDGTYFQLVDYSGISELDDKAFCDLLLKEYCIAAIPLYPFYKNGNPNKVVRLCFAKKDETLKRAGEVLNKVFE